MESLVYTANQVAELFQISLTAVYDLRNKGKLKQLPNVSGVRFSKKEVEALAGVESEYSAIGYRKLKNEVERLEKENNRLKSEIKKNHQPNASDSWKGFVMKFIWLVRIISVILISSSMGSVELEKIDGYTGFLQIALGVTLLILSNFWVREIKKAR